MKLARVGFRLHRRFGGKRNSLKYRCPPNSFVPRTSFQVVWQIDRQSSILPPETRPTHCSGYIQQQLSHRAILAQGLRCLSPLVVLIDSARTLAWTNRHCRLQPIITHDTQEHRPATSYRLPER